MGQCFFSCFFLTDHFLEGEYFFLDNRGENQDGNEVRDSHEGVGDIGEIPYQIQGLGGAYEYHKGEGYAINDVVFMGAEEVFPGFFAIVFPAEDVEKAKRIMPMETM